MERRIPLLLLVGRHIQDPNITIEAATIEIAAPASTLCSCEDKVLRELPSLHLSLFSRRFMIRHRTMSCPSPASKPTLALLRARASQPAPSATKRCAKAFCRLDSYLGFPRIRMVRMFFQSVPLFGIVIATMRNEACSAPQRA